MADRGGQWRVEAVLDVERRPTAGAQGRGQRWVRVRWQGLDEATGEPWGEEWLWCGFLNPSAAAEARAIELRRDAAVRQEREAAAALRAATRLGALEQGRAAERGTRTRPAEAGPRRSRRQAGAPPELGRRCVSETQGNGESVWRARRRVPGRVLEVRGAARLQAVKVRWTFADGSEGGGTMWVSPRQLPRVARRMAAAKWEQRQGRAGATSSRRMDTDTGGADPELVAAARRLGLQRAQRVQGGVRLYDDEQRRSRLVKRLREAGFGGMLERAGEVATTTGAGDCGTREPDDEEQRQRRRGRACGTGMAGESMGDGGVLEPTVAGYGGAGLQSGLPFGRGDG